MWNWLTFICDKDKREVEKVMEENEEIKKANEQLEYLTGDEAVRRIAFLRDKAEWDYVTNMNGAREEGIEKGRKEGRKEGKEGLIEGKKKEKIEIAKEMLAKKFDISTIVEITKLTKEEVEELKEKN